MTTNEVAILTGLSISYINKVRCDKTTNLSQDTINKVKFLLSLEVNFLEALFSRPEFFEICTSVLKASDRAHKNMVNIVRFSNKCLRRHRSLMNTNRGETLKPDEINAQHILGIYVAEIKDMFKNEMFPQMCEVAIKVNSKNPDLRAYADFMMDISEYLRDLDNKRLRKEDKNG